ncbi:pyruvate formate lyase family protein [Deltaproteobacteria bacterium TL4]
MVPNFSQSPIASEPFDVKTLTLSHFPRLQRMRAEHINAQKTVCIERARLVTEFFRKEGVSEAGMVLKQAKALKYILANLPVPVFEEELLVGSTTQHRFGCLIFPEFFGAAIFSELPNLSKRKFDPVHIKESDIDLLAEDIFPFWQNDTIFEYARKKGNDPESLRILERMIFYILSKPNGISHIIPDYSSAVNMGLEHLIEQARFKEKSTVEPEKIEFYHATQMALRAVIDFAERYAVACEKKAVHASPEREKELRHLASVLRNVPAKPARTLEEALQTIWLLHVALHQENVNTALSFGRLDQILNPFYQNDLATSKITPQKAGELIGCFYLKMSDHTPLVPEAGKDIVGGTGTSQALTLGGLTPDGKDGVNEITFLMLKMLALLSTREPNVTARVHSESTPEYHRALVEAIYQSGAMPALFNDDVTIKSLTENGVALEDARDYGVIGCVEINSAGRTMGATGAIILNLAAVLELTLYGGVHPLSRLKIGPKTPSLEAIKNFDDFMQAFDTQLKYLIELAVDGNRRFAEAHGKLHPTPLLSSLIQGTLESGCDITQGGAKYNSTGIAIIGFADVIDSFCALQELVFEQHRISKKTLISALISNFEQDQKTYTLLKKQASKYGTDHELADRRAIEVVQNIHQLFNQQEHPRGGNYTVGYWSATMHSGMGMLTGALPNGKRRGEALSSGATPVSGVASKGPTASLSSTAKLPYQFMDNGIANNHKISRSLLKTPGKLAVLSQLIKGYFKQGGMQVQFTIHDRETLIHAQLNPDAYRDLLVRVSGYTAYFCDLNRKMQDEIITRTEDHF